MKRSLVFLPVVILMAFTLGCQDQQALVELEEMKVKQKSRAEQEIVLRLYEDIDNQQFEEALAAFPLMQKCMAFRA